MKHEQQAESVEDVEETGCPEDVEKNIDFRWNFNSCFIGQLGETQSQCSVIPITTKLAHGCTHSEYHHHDWHKLTTKMQPVSFCKLLLSISYLSKIGCYFYSYWSHLKMYTETYETPSKKILFFCFPAMCFIVTFITAICVLFVVKLRWPIWRSKYMSRIKNILGNGRRVFKERVS